MAFVLCSSSVIDVILSGKPAAAAAYMRSFHVACR